MALRLVDDTSEPIRVQLAPGAHVLVRPLSHETMQELRDRHLKPGQTDAGPLRRATFARCLAGWEGIEDARGNPVPFDPARAADLGMRLPDHMAVRVLGAARSGADEVEGAAGN